MTLSLQTTTLQTTMTNDSDVLRAYVDRMLPVVRAAVSLDATMIAHGLPHGLPGVAQREHRALHAAVREYLRYEHASGFPRVETESKNDMPR